MSMGLRYRAGAMGIPFMPSRTMMGSDVGKRVGDELKTMTCPFTGEKWAAAGAQSRRGADPRAALRCLRQRPARRPAVHGPRHGHGGQARHPDDRAHRLQRADPPYARPDAHSLLHRGGGGGGADRAARRTSATACTSRSSRTSTTMLRAPPRTPSRAPRSISSAITTGRSPGPTISPSSAWTPCSMRAAAAGAYTMTKHSAPTPPTRPPSCCA